MPYLHLTILTLGNVSYDRIFSSIESRCTRYCLTKVGQVKKLLLLPRTDLLFLETIESERERVFIDLCRYAAKKVERGTIVFYWAIHSVRY